MKLCQLERGECRRLMRASLGLALLLALPSVACSGKLDRSKENEPGADGALRGATESPKPSDSAQAGSAHLLQIIEIERATGQARTLLARRVGQPLPRRHAAPSGPTWQIETLDQEGQLLDGVAIADPSRVRAEFSTDGELEGTTVDKPVVTLPVRVPLLPRARRLRVRDHRGQTVGEVDYRQVPP